MSAPETIALDWRKSSHSTQATDCVETAPAPGGMAVRDSKDPHGHALMFQTAAWSAFVGAVKSGDIPTL